jgi:SAM-dependent methyltransferase
MSISIAKEVWNDRYRTDEYVYGEHPNEYLRVQLEKLTPANILFPAEGEGRNAVFSAVCGWDVTAFDISDEGRAKALKLADKHGVSIDYLVGELNYLDLPAETFHAIGLIYAHFPNKRRADIHKSLIKLLKPGGYLILEGFSKENLDYVAKNPGIGGPRDEALLFTAEQIAADFAELETIELTQSEIQLSEGLLHNGTGSVIRFTGRKI